MKNGINLSLTKSLVDFDKLLEQAVAAVSSKNLSLPDDDECTEIDSWKFQVGRYVQIGAEDETEDGEESEKALFWIGFGWEENDSIWLEFNEKTCPDEYWDKLNELVGTSGKYYSKVDLESSQEYMNAWIHFYLEEEHLKQFYNENAGIQSQKELLTAFITEVVDKLTAAEAEGEDDTAGYDQAIAEYTVALRIDPNDASAYNNRGFAYACKGDFDKAIADYTAALRINPNDVEALNGRGNVHCVDGDINLAIEDFTAALRLDPNNAGTLSIRGHMYTYRDERGDYDRAITDYNAALRIDPAYVYALCNRGEAYKHQGEIEKAIADFEAALRIDPDYTYAKKNLRKARRNKAKVE
jgi:tetratricopeptide (TPR) repeat protein